ncbi:MAG: heavy-metal-associated domain-containing protein [Dehalococcoidia bacterium]
MARDVTLRIPAIHCSSCVKTVTRTLEALPSLEIIKVDPGTKLVQVRFEETVASLDQVREALDEVGFSAEE